MALVKHGCNYYGKTTTRSAPYCLVNVDGFRLKEAMQKKSTVEEEET